MVSKARPMNPLDTFDFLDAASAKEPHLVELLDEIFLAQRQSLPSGERPLAGVEHLKKSRNIKIPFASGRDKAIDYLIELILTRFPEQVRPIISFDFRVEETSKKLSVTESAEFTVQMSAKDFERIRDLRDARSRDNLIQLLRRYRFFNLTKLIKISKNREDLQRIIRLEEGKQIFIFKNFDLDKNRLEYSEDYCFHTQNYDAVTKSINLGSLREVLARHSELVLRRLKNFGILSASFADYRDAKLDYIFNILIHDLSSTLAPLDLITVKNIHSLRACLLSADTVLDPLQTLGKDITRCIAESPICTFSDIAGSTLEITQELLEKWATPENLRANNILSFRAHDGSTYLVDASRLVELCAQLSKLIIHDPEGLSELPYAERQKAAQRMEVLYRLARQVLSSEETIKELKLADNDTETLKRIVREYEGHLEKSIQRRQEQRQIGRAAPRKSFLARIVDFFRRLFGGGRSERGARHAGRAPGAPRHLSAETRHIVRKIASVTAPILALSDFIELIPENDDIVDTLLEDLREHRIKLVVPIYKARELLYPVRSTKLLMNEMEYLLVPMEVARSPESIRSYTDSLVGVKLKDEVIPAKGIMAVEKYLLTYYRQKRAQMLKKEF